MSDLAHAAFETGPEHLDAAVIGHLASPFGTHLPTHLGVSFVHKQTGFAPLQSQSEAGSGVRALPFESVDPEQVHSFLPFLVHLQSFLIFKQVFSPLVQSFWSDDFTICVQVLPSLPCSQNSVHFPSASFVLQCSTSSSSYPHGQAMQLSSAFPAMACAPHWLSHSVAPSNGNPHV